MGLITLRFFTLLIVCVVYSAELKPDEGLCAPQGVAAASVTVPVVSQASQVFVPAAGSVVAAPAVSGRVIFAALVFMAYLNRAWWYTEKHDARTSALVSDGVVTLVHLNII